MCYHFKDEDTQEYIDEFVRFHGIKSWTHRGFRYYINGFNHSLCLVMKQGAGELVEMKWGLIPFWVKTAEQAKEVSNRTLNAKSETVFELASFRGSIKTKKCLIISSGFYEWRHIDAKNKIPYLIGVRDKKGEGLFSPFTFGGIYDTWVDKESGEVHETFSIITTPANSMMEVIHITARSGCR